MLSTEEEHELANNLYNAILNKDEKQVDNILDLFSNNNIKPDFDIQNKPIIITAIIHASNNIVLKLLEAGANPNVTTNLNTFMGTTPLHVAVCNKFTEKAQYLLNFGAKINAQESKGHTSLHLAVFLNNLELSKMLLEGKADITIKNNANCTPLKIANILGYQEMIELFKEIENNQIIKDETFSLSLKCADGKVSDDDLKMLLEGIIPEFIEKGRLDFANRDNFVSKFTGKSSYKNIIDLIFNYNKLLVSQAKDIYGTDNIKLLPKENTALEETNIQLTGGIPPLIADDAYDL